MRAAVVRESGDVEIETRPVPQLGPGELLVRTQASGICTGDVMAWYIKRKAPCVLGHEPAGFVAAVGQGEEPRGESGRTFRVGDRVFVHHHAPCFACAACERGDYVQCATWRSTKIDPGGIAEYFRVPRENVNDTLLLPENVSFADASLIEPLACVCKSLRRGGVRSGDRVLVIGLGVMGLMHVAAARALGAEVAGSDFIEERRRLAQNLGAGALDPRDGEKPFGAGADVAICGPGTNEAMQAAIAAVRPGGTVVMFTPFPPEQRLEVDPDRFYFADLRLVASYSCGPNDTRAALALIAGGTVSASKLGATLVPLEDVARAYRDLAASRIVKPIVTF